MSPITDQSSSTSLNFSSLSHSKGSNIDSWRLSALGSESLHSSQTACMYAQYAHAAPSHTPYLDDTNFIAALRDKDLDKEKDRNKEMGKEKDKDKVRGRDRVSSEASRELYDISAQNDAREVLLDHFYSLLSYCFSLLSSYPFSLLMPLLLCYATSSLLFLDHKYRCCQFNSTFSIPYLNVQCISISSPHHWRK